MAQDDVASTSLPPTESEWARHGWSIVDELHGGHQSRLYRVTGTDGDFVAKLTDGRFVDDAYFARLELALELGALEPRVVGPMRVRGSLVRELGNWYAVAYPFVLGRSPDHQNRSEVSSMAAALARLHRALRGLDGARIPPVAALRSTPAGLRGSGPDQLLHGDYARSNIKVTADGLRILDLDDAGRGPVEFEIGNTLYMELFDATLRDDLGGYLKFRGWFLDGYDGAATGTLQLDVIDSAIALRKLALAKWLDDLANAPPGIRSASLEWRRLLRRFTRLP